MWKYSRKRVNKSNRTARDLSYNLYFFEAVVVHSNKALLERLRQIGVCSSYHHLKDILSYWAANAFQVYENTNQVIPLKLRGMIFTTFTKDNIDKNSKSNEATKHSMAQAYVLFRQWN